MRFVIESIHREWISSEVFELEFTRPLALEFLPGQHIRFHSDGLKRDYTLVSLTADPHIRILVQQVRHSGFSNTLAKCAMGDSFEISGPHGHFFYRTSGVPAVFIGTGTGIAPFAAFARSGVSGYILLQGAKTADRLIYSDLLAHHSRAYVPCLSKCPSALSDDTFHGRVTDYLSTILPDGSYRFYLCGRRQMILDAMAVIDERFPNCRVFTERFT